MNRRIITLTLSFLLVAVVLTKLIVVLPEPAELAFTLFQLGLALVVMFLAISMLVKDSTHQQDKD